ncbi:MAG TPA: hypothetical protein DCX54_00935 [Flavobacteriales bacterium]|nr:hypothetical protein [Flavobacteriales bacterium]
MTASNVFFLLASLGIAAILISLMQYRPKKTRFSRLFYASILLILLGGAVESRMMGSVCMLVAFIIAVLDWVINRKPSQ